ncbi:MAG: hypothetical protein ABGY41_13585 [Candidatus Poribacteria bacterium]
MRRRRRAWSESAGASKSGRGVIRDFNTQVDMPAYQYRTVSVERAVLHRLARRWAPIGLAVVALVVGPFAGGWYFERGSVARNTERVNARTFGHLRDEIATASAALRQQAVSLTRVEGGDTSEAGELKARYGTEVWRAASLQLDEVAADPAFAAVSGFYGKLLDVEQATSRYLHTVDHAQFSASVTAGESAAIMAGASRLLSKVEAAAAAGEAIVSSLPASGG